MIVCVDVILKRLNEDLQLLYNGVRIKTLNGEMELYCPISFSTLASNDNKLKQSSGQMLVLLKIHCTVHCVLGMSCSVQ